MAAGGELLARLPAEGGGLPALGAAVTLHLAPEDIHLLALDA
jgi:hypothetical protein